MSILSGENKPEMRSPQPFKKSALNQALTDAHPRTADQIVLKNREAAARPLGGREEFFQETTTQGMTKSLNAGLEPFDAAS